MAAQLFDDFNLSRPFSRLTPESANELGQPAFGAYLRSPNNTRHATGLFVLTLRGKKISALTRFESNVLPWFNVA